MNDLALPPSVLSDRPHPKMSPRYVYHDAREVIRILESEGFALASASAPAVRRGGRDPAFSKHVLDFRMPEAPVVEGTTPRVLYVGSHDGTTASRIMLGAFRFICSNGLVVGSTYAREVVRHSGQQAAEFIDRIRSLAKSSAPLFAQIERWSKIDMSASERHEFARLAAVLRFGDAQRFAPEQLLTPRRAEDDRGDLWSVFNRVQENAIAGGLEGATADGRRLTSRRLAAIDASLSFNAQLWALAEEFAE